MMETLSYTLEGKTYAVLIQRKRMKSITYRFRDGQFLISAPRIASNRAIIMGLNKFAKKMIDRSTEDKAQSDEFVYIFGKKESININDYDDNYN